MTIDNRVHSLVNAPESEIVTGSPVDRLAEINALRELHALRQGQKPKSKGPLVVAVLGVLLLLVGVASLWVLKPAAVAHVDLVTSRARFALSPDAEPLVLGLGLSGLSIEMRGKLRVMDDPFLDGNQAWASLRFACGESPDEPTAQDSIMIERIEIPAGAEWSVDATRWPTLGMIIHSPDKVIVQVHAPESANIMSGTEERGGQAPLDVLAGAIKIAAAAETDLRIDIHGWDHSDSLSGFEFYHATGARIAGFEFEEPVPGGRDGQTRYLSAIQSGSVAFSTANGTEILRELRFRERLEAKQVDGKLLRLRLIDGGLAASLTGEVRGLQRGSSGEMNSAMPTLFQYVVGEDARGYLSSMVGYLIVLIIASIIAHVIRKWGGSASAAEIAEGFTQ